MRNSSSSSNGLRINSTYASITLVVLPAHRLRRFAFREYESSRIFEKPFKHLFAGVARGCALCLGYGAVPHFSLFLRRLWRRKREKKYFGSNSLDRDVPRSPTEGSCPLHSRF